MKLPKSVTRVTGFSKTLTLILILAFIVSAFYVGMMFQRKSSEMLATINPSPTVMPASQVSCGSDSDCVLTTAETKNSCCPNTRCLNFADETTVAVNAKWLETDKVSVCGTRHLCPMIATMCTKTIMQENARYSAKCVAHVCQKVRS